MTSRGAPLQDSFIGKGGYLSFDRSIKVSVYAVEKEQHKSLVNICHRSREVLINEDVDGQIVDVLS